MKGQSIIHWGVYIILYLIWLGSFLRANQLIRSEGIMTRIVFYFLAVLFVFLICIWERKVLFVGRFTRRQTLRSALHQMGLTILPIILKGIVTLFSTI